MNENVDYAFLGAWNFKKEIFKKKKTLLAEEVIHYSCAKSFNLKKMTNLLVKNWLNRQHKKQKLNIKKIKLSFVKGWIINKNI